MRLNAIQRLQTYRAFLEDGIAISAPRVKDKKLVKVKDWSPTNSFRLRVKATVVKYNKRRIKKHTFIYENIKKLRMKSSELTSR